MERVLVVDDSSITRRLVCMVLEGAGYEVGTAENGLEALEKLYRGEWELVIADVNMPMMDGVDLVRHVRGDPAYRHLPVVVLSSEAAGERVRQALAAGADLYLAKPVPPEKLVATVRTLLAGSRGCRRCGR